MTHAAMTTGPGDVCAHTHLYSGLAPLGMPAPEEAPETFVQILERVWWRLDRALDAESLAASARYYVANALLSGTTTLIDHHESPGFIAGSLDVLADACAELGIRALMCFGATERNGGRAEAQAGLAECRRFIRDNRRPHIIGAVALHASFTVSDETIRDAARLCAELDAPMHVHMAEAHEDVGHAVEAGWPGPFERLLNQGALPPGSLMAHGVYLDEDQVRRAADEGLWLIHNPRSNEGNRVGYASALSASERVALGTDGWPAEMADEEEALLTLAGAHGDALDIVRARRPAGVVLAEELFGEGVAHDTVSRDPDGKVVHVEVGGRVLVQNGQLVTADMATIVAEAAAAAERLWDRMRSL